MNDQTKTGVAGQEPTTPPPKQQEAKGWVIYPIGSRPKMGMAIMLGIQQYLTMFGATVLIPFIVAGAIGMPQHELALLISTMFFVSGIATLIQQSPLGNRLPIIQGGTFSFLGPMFAIVGIVATHGESGLITFTEELPQWKYSIQQISVAVMFASVIEIVLGYSGIMGKVKRLIGPIVIGPTIALIGLGLFSIGAPWMATNWTISIITLVALILYSQVFSRKSRAFLLFPVLLAIMTGWGPLRARNRDRDNRRWKCRQFEGWIWLDRGGRLGQLFAGCAVQVGLPDSNQYYSGRRLRDAGRVPGLDDRIDR